MQGVKNNDYKMDQSPTDIFHFDDMRFNSTATSHLDHGDFLYSHRCLKTLFDKLGEVEECDSSLLDSKG